MPINSDSFLYSLKSFFVKAGEWLSNFNKEDSISLDSVCTSWFKSLSNSSLTKYLNVKT